MMGLSFHVIDYFKWKQALASNYMCAQCAFDERKIN